MAMPKNFIQIGGAVLSALYSIGSLVADANEWLPSVKWQYHAIGGFLLFAIFMIWIIWDKQKQIDEFTNGIYLNASLNPKTYNSKTGFIIDIEIWTNKDIHTDNLVLNFEAVRGLTMLTTPWWNIRKLWTISLENYPFFKKVFGLRTENWEYRKHIKPSDDQPFADTVTFKFINIRDMFKWSNTFMMELVLVTGVPKGKFRKYIGTETLKQKTLEPDLPPIVIPLVKLDLPVL
jgi:hypothetical protein